MENIGSEPIWNVLVTDTYPVSTTFNNNWWHDYWQNVSLTHYPGQQEFVWTVEQLDPGWSTWLYANLDLTGAAVGVPGLIFTNTAVVQAVPGEVNPGDVLPVFAQSSNGWLQIDLIENLLFIKAGILSISIWKMSPVRPSQGGWICHL